jgi:hypothetical protein
MGNIIALYVFTTLTERSATLPANSTNLPATPKPPRGGGGLLTLSEISPRPSYSKVPGYVKTYLLRYYCQYFALVFSLISKSWHLPPLGQNLTGMTEDRALQHLLSDRYLHFHPVSTVVEIGDNAAGSIELIARIAVFLSKCHTYYWQSLF